MSDSHPCTPESRSSAQNRSRKGWSERYGQRHRLRRISEFPAGVVPPARVRIYARHGHYVLQWWDPAAKANLCERIDGDLLDALIAARQIEQRLADYRSSGRVRRRLRHDELVEKFLEDLQRRCDAGAIAPATMRRYRSALAHYRAFTEQPGVLKAWPTVVSVDRKFALDFAAFLEDRCVAPNGHPHAQKHRLRGQAFVLDVVRAVFEWANDPRRGNCLPAGFRTPFRRATMQRRRPARDPLAAPEITLEMARQLLRACDDYQLPIFALVVLYGVRAAEPVYVFREHIQRGWLRIGCIPELGYTTKGLRDKRLPLLEEIHRLWPVGQVSSAEGLLFVRRGVSEGREVAPMFGASLAHLVREFERRCGQAKASSAAAKQRVRDAVIKGGGGLSYDHVDGEFRRLAGGLQWPASATLKDFRHLFCTAMTNGGMTEHEIKYLLGHAPGKQAIIGYTHLDQIAQHYRRAVEHGYRLVLEVLRSRILS